MWTQRRESNQSIRTGDHRNPYQRDKARILHSAAFRRLQAKTQVLGVGMSDFYRTRLTHSLEASQIGQGITAQLRNKYPELTQQLDVNEQLIEALCLAHDIGHPPFGHGGEVALHYKMYKHGGFEGNGQTFRIVGKLEPYTLEHGMNLSRRTMLGLVKYPNFIDNLTNQRIETDQVPHRQVKADLWHPPKGLYTCDTEMFNWLLEPLSENDKNKFVAFNQFDDKHSKTRFKTFDCSIMELADDIAYGIHDLEDAIVMGIIHREQFQQEVTAKIKDLTDFVLSENIDSITNKLFSEYHHQRKDAIGALVNAFITSIEIVPKTEHFDEPLLAYDAAFPISCHKALGLFKTFVFNRVIRKPDIQLIEYKGQQIVMELFEAIQSDPARLLPENTRVRWRAAELENNGNRVIADYISGMTDGFASKLYSTLFLPKSGSINDQFSG
ncbi:anti-phage deoxyguanosine triphosphatase [Aliiglaciecola sp. 2_MG-2023]|uniref:anti-phage deoxyguanosine triphosphatase n=1 Tax=Alteromonadaceae TaxID=72275 RepID=UPI0026E44FD0|nr:MULTISPECIES: anti-phage deoxyguanosine triphosphatase [unclassified Aliiglaciecola]MDO6710490.1 anti-phage deoxyguanosine triphosphatase [Aliiglaciecola sp. 2_MG-2023]MDO6751645.1 anti-phage deoxyguanosine triphosphatase [Aliiglaciecola sp. 1_MG-2023]